MVFNGNRDSVSDNGNREGARVEITNFNQPQASPEMGHPRKTSSKCCEGVVRVL